MTKRRIITLLVVVIGIAATIYAISIVTNNFAILVASPLVLGLLGCPLMCGVMVGGMWLSRRLSRNKQKDTLQKNMGACCQHDHVYDHEHKPANYSDKGTISKGKESSGKSASTEAKGKNSPNFNPPQPTSNSKFKNSS